MHLWVVVTGEVLPLPPQFSGCAAIVSSRLFNGTSSLATGREEPPHSHFNYGRDTSQGHPTCP